MNLNCVGCVKTFDNFDRNEIPLPCGDPICLICFDKLYDPEKRILICPSDDKEQTITLKFKENRVDSLRRKGMAVVCDQHPDREVDFFCITCRAFGCLQCRYQQHAHHQHRPFGNRSPIVSDYFKNVDAKCTKLEEEVSHLQAKIESLKKAGVKITSSDLMELTKRIAKLLLPYCESDADKQKLIFPSKVQEQEDSYLVNLNPTFGCDLDDKVKQVLQIDQYQKK